MEVVILAAKGLFYLVLGFLLISLLELRRRYKENGRIDKPIMIATLIFSLFFAVVAYISSMSLSLKITVMGAKLLFYPALIVLCVKLFELGYSYKKRRKINAGEAVFVFVLLIFFCRVTYLSNIFLDIS
ncbi:hypothetical protein [Aneurinibacillus aneurinilyticus]|uniref:Uncharacterized protein n=1 Tax=Aneurinibacillus aneurinilyticus ATCC 12856 TaxID=649747 RepID=U1WFA0_ANEAE|nr:hypothetical protein [Aneurinibacillus aneurinilyticus]ERI07229.1 hypothetical protein HMPREF0083_04700 [Aneurinibacillus aneurinilyticus ATCC 12856]MED0706838.1 hypothetical protein [Aneurinibacillus aneurinilyticus]MED0725913.1 hypothetical protein [Aneurinibacillus aneurinilyticus]MED0730376.1 hypothetical protein [Aneurinibacillus aneurinilyticus]MED0739205.1 hypothetical protein [Aneurinibacillus aneurinilyticus]